MTEQLVAQIVGMAIAAVAGLVGRHVEERRVTTEVDCRRRDNLPIPHGDTNERD